jgi:hypothetical protein
MTRTPGLPKRDIPDTNVEGEENKNTLPKRNEIWVQVEVRRFDPLAQVRKGWGSKLKLLLSQYLTGRYNNKAKWEKHALQTLLHEMMHIALWDDQSIVHSTDETSLLHEYIDGSKQEPNEWDLAMMKAAAERVDLIVLDGAKILHYEVWPILELAVIKWNRWIGRELFTLLS